MLKKNKLPLNNKSTDSDPKVQNSPPINIKLQSNLKKKPNKNENPRRSSENPFPHDNSNNVPNSSHFSEDNQVSKSNNELRIVISGNARIEAEKNRTETKTPAFKERGESLHSNEIAESQYFQNIVADNRKMKAKNKENDELIRLFREAFNLKKQTLTEQSSHHIQNIDSQIQQILSNRKKHSSFETMARKGTSSMEKNLTNMKELTFRPRVIRTTTPVKAGIMLFESNSHHNFADINEFKRIEVPSEVFPVPELAAQKGQKEPQLHLPPIINAPTQKITFTGTFNPHTIDRNCGLMKQKPLVNKQELQTGILQKGFFRLEDAIQSRAFFGKEPESEPQNKRKFPREVFASNVKRRFFV